MNIESQILEDSIFGGSRLTTYLVTIPKYLVYDITRHRCMSYSIASTRAIKFEKLLEKMEFVPTYFGKNKAGMQADEEVNFKDQARLDWKNIQKNIKRDVTNFYSKHGVHKQTIGRLFEPTCFVKCLITGTDWPSFFSLRAEYAAEPHLGYLATIMLKQYIENKPKQLDQFEWHIPYIKEQEKTLPIKDKLIISTARCARTSYDNQYGTNDFEKDKSLFERLKNDGHWSPFEHQAQAMYMPNKNSNFSKYWQQQRKLVEVHKPLDLNQRLADMIELCKQRGFSF